MKKIFAVYFFLFLFISLLTHAEETAPENFGALIRYNFLRNSPIEEVHSSKEWQCEDLPSSQIERDPYYGFIRVIRGQVSQLPYQFIIKIMKKDQSDPGIIEADIVDPATHQSLYGYPHQIPNTLGITNDMSDQTVVFLFELPKSLESQLLKKYLTSHGSSKSDRIFVEPLIKVGIGKEFFKEIDKYKNLNL